MTDLPRWQARDERDIRLMRWWLNEKLDEMFDEQLENEQRQIFRSGTVEEERFLKWLAADGPQIEAANRGNIRPLKKRYPHLAPFLRAPTRGKKGKYQRPKPSVALQLAAEDVGRIRELWKKHYGRKNRHSDDGESAEKIAAKRWDVDVEDLIKRLKKSAKK